MVNIFSKKFWIFYLSEIICVFLIVTGVLPREGAFFLTAVILLYLLHVDPEEGGAFIIASIPFFVALPFSENFDRMANWRIIIVFFFLLTWAKIGLSVKFGRWYFRERDNIKHFIFEYLFLAFLLWSFFSLIVAFDPISGFKKIIFIINLVLFYVILRNILRISVNSHETLKKIFMAIGLAGMGSLTVAYSQQITIFFVEFFNFWQWWASNVIPAFYGHGLAELLKETNTWFAYYENSMLTLRVFGAFPDSHSFALFSILTIPAFLYLWREKLLKSWLFFPVLILTLFGLILSGSRGIWLSFLAPVFLFFIFYWFFRNRLQPYRKIVVAGILLFIALFLLNSPFLALESKLQGNQAEGDLGFQRAKSIVDLNEVSNSSRLLIWEKSYQSILDKPFLGVGMGNFPMVLEEDPEAIYRGASAHNLYLNIGTEIGILGLLLFLAIMFFVVKMSFQNLKDNNNNPREEFNFVFLFVLIWLLAYSVFDVVLLNDKVFLLFLTLIPLLCIVQKTKKNT